MMTDLHYFPSQQILCWIAGYTGDDNTSRVVDKIKLLQNNAERFAKHCGVDISAVHTLFIEDSSWYKYMRVFYTKIAQENIPDDAYIHNESRKMFEYLQQ